jgi:penicillin-binding protein 1C
VLPKDFDETINEVVFKLAHRSPETIVYWYLDSEFIGTTQTFHELAIAPKPGEYILSVMDQDGNELRQKVVIK